MKAWKKHLKRIKEFNHQISKSYKKENGYINTFNSYNILRMAPGNGRYKSLRSEFYLILSLFQMKRKTRRSNIASCMYKKKQKKKYENASANVSGSLKQTVPFTECGKTQLKSKENEALFSFYSNSRRK